MGRFKTISLIITLIFQIYCNSLSVSKYKGGLKGIGYHMPKTIIQIGSKYIITDCKNDIKFKILVSLKEIQVQDEEAKFLLDYSSLSSLTKNTELGLDFFDNGTLKSINADIKDQNLAIAGKSVEFVTSLISARYKISNQNFSGEVPKSLNSEIEIYMDGKKLEFCEASTLRNLEVLNIKKSTFKILETKKQDLNLELAELEKKYSINFPLSINNQEQIKIKKDEINQITKKLDDISKEIENIIQKLTINIEYTYEYKKDDKKEYKEYIPTVVPFKESKLFSDYGLCLLIAENFEMPYKCNITSEYKLVEKFYFYSKLFLNKVEPGKVEPDKNGLKVRLPISGEFEICRDKYKSSFCDLDKRLGILDVSINQAGNWYYFPLENYPFQNNTLSISFSPSGNIKSFKYKDSTNLSNAVDIGKKAIDAYTEQEKKINDSKINKIEDKLDNLDSDKKRIERLKSIFPELK